MNEEQMKHIANLISQNIEKDKEILEMKHRINDLIKDNTEYKLENLRLNNIINTFEEDLEREVNISAQESMVGNYRYTVIHSTLEKMLKYFKELKESGNNE